MTQEGNTIKMHDHYKDLYKAKTCKAIVGWYVMSRLIRSGWYLSVLISPILKAMVQVSIYELVNIPSSLCKSLYEL